jgi:hypothetical protein
LNLSVMRKHRRRSRQNGDHQSKAYQSSIFHQTPPKLIFEIRVRKDIHPLAAANITPSS